MQTTFSAGSICIRRFQPDDVPLLYEAARESISELARWLPWCHPNYSIEESKEWVLSRVAAWDKDEEYSFAIIDLPTQTFLGGCGLHHINKLDRCANVGYWVRTNWSRKGAASAATRLIANFGFQEASLNRLELIIAAANAPSQRAAEKAGAKKEGLLRKRIFQHGVVHDAFLYSLVREDLSA